MPEPAWEHVDHGADIGVRGFGESPAQAFANAGLALTALVCEPERVRPLAAVAFELEGEDLEFLFFDWLNRLIYEMATRRMLFGRFAVALEGGRLSATVYGEPVEVARHRPAVEVKGPTLTELKVAETAPGRWLAQCIVDV